MVFMVFNIVFPTFTVCLACILKFTAVCNAFFSLLFPFNVDVLAIIQAREFLSKLGDLNQTQIFAKIENVEVLDLYE